MIICIYVCGHAKNTVLAHVIHALMIIYLTHNQNTNNENIFSCITLYN